MLSVLFAQFAETALVLASAALFAFAEGHRRDALIWDDPPKYVAMVWVMVVAAYVLVSTL